MTNKALQEELRDAIQKGSREWEKIEKGIDKGIDKGLYVSRTGRSEFSIETAEQYVKYNNTDS